MGDDNPVLSHGRSGSVSSARVNLRGSRILSCMRLAFRDSLHGVIAGGDYQHPEQTGAHLATTEDGGKTWKLADVTPQSFFSAISYIGGTNGGIAVVGSAASALSRDELHSWLSTNRDGFNAVESKQGVTYAVGAGGRIAKLQP